MTRHKSRIKRRKKNQHLALQTIQKRFSKKTKISRNKKQTYEDQRHND